MSLPQFSAPDWFWLLVVVAAGVAAYLWTQRRQRHYALRFANLALLERVMPRRPGWPRHVPAALLAVAMLLLVVGLAGPLVQTEVPRNRATVILAIDVSLSMQATDVAPSRLRVAQDAATRFADQLPTGINLGLIAFAGNTSLLVAPTRDREAVKRGVGALRLEESTATGDAILASLAAVRSFAAQVPSPDGPPPARTILLSDGKQTVPTTDPAESPRGAFPAADRARIEGVPISAVSLGTQYGEIEIDGRPVAVPAADDDMRQIAARSGGQYFQASTDSDLRQSYAALADQIGYETLPIDVGKTWVALGTVAALVAACAGLVLTQRLPA